MRKRFLRARRLQIESLEDRRLLAGAPIAGLGVAGDSLSDEYAVETYNYARNWNELLVEETGINLGPAGNYPEPRRSGYAFNWARAGADSGDLLAAGQHTQLAAQIEAGLVSHAVLAIGQNDFYPEDPPYINIAHGLWTPQQIQTYADQVVSNVETALAELADTNALVVMANIADYGVAPLTRQFFNAQQRDRVSAVIEAVNVRLAALAEQYDTPLVDLNGVARFFFGSNQAPAASWPIGGVTITNAAGVGPANAFVDDGIHPHTIVQAQMANLFLTAFQLAYDTPVDLFTEAESLALEGVPYGGADTLGLNFAEYVRLPASEPPAASWTNAPDPNDVDDDGEMRLFDLLAVVRFLRERGTVVELPAPDAEFRPPPYVDVNGDGRATLGDLLAVVQALRDRMFAGDDGEGERPSSSIPFWLDDEDSPPPPQPE